MFKRYHRNAAEGPDPVHQFQRGTHTTKGYPFQNKKRNGPFAKDVRPPYPDSRTTQERTP